MKFNFKPQLSNGGFSLPEVLLAAGLIGGLTLAIMKLIEMQNAGSKLAFQNQTINQVLTEINTLLAREGTCTQSLTVPNTTNISSGDSQQLTIYRKVGNGFSPRFNNSTYKKIDTSLEITSIVARKNPNAPIGNDERGPFQVAISFSRLGKNPRDYTKTVSVIGKLENGVVKDCISYEIEAIEETRRKLCEEDLGGEINSDGRCVKSGGAAGRIIKETACEMIGGTVDGNGLCTNISFSDSIKIGSGNATCATQADAGRVQYDLTNNRFAFCEGDPVKWTNNPREKATCSHQFVGSWCDNDCMSGSNSGTITCSCASGVTPVMTGACLKNERGAGTNMLADTCRGSAGTCICTSIFGTDSCSF